MPTLKEFVDQVLIENNIVSDADEIIKKIYEIAREREEDGCAIISDEEVRDMVINNADLANKLAEERKAKAEEVRRQREEREAAAERAKKEKELKKQLEEERKAAGGEQLNLFG